MREPLVVEVTRGAAVESVHLVDVAVVDAAGAPLDSWGDPRRNVLPRSAIKPIQALPLLATGAADAAALSVAELALACASHGGEPRHVALVDDWLGRLGLDVSALECGPHAPTHEPSARELLRAGRGFDARHNTCSGKHCGFLCVCRHLGLDPAGYIRPHHPLQRDHVTPAIAECCRVDLSGVEPGIDGCGIPVWPMPLDRLAAGWASLRGDERGRRLFDAMVAEPWMVAGTNRFDTSTIAAAGGRAVAKTGAEGVHVAVDLTSGRAIAVKARDGATRAAEAAIAWLMARVELLAPPSPVVLRNWAGTEVGEIRVRA